MTKTTGTGNGETFKVGLAIGQGTGPELAKVFQFVLERLASQCAVNVEIIRCPQVYHTYFSMNPEGTTPRTIQSQTERDVQNYEAFCAALLRKGTHILFRTAINAQSLYLIRENVQAVKIESFGKGSDSLLLVRDQAQGFYTGTNEYGSNFESVSRTAKFSKVLIGRIIMFSLARAKQLWSDESVTTVDLVYKFHLFDGVMTQWADDWTKQFGVKIQFVQPDTANRNLLKFGIQGKQLIIAGNEWADIMHVMLLQMLGREAQEDQCTENVYLKPGMNGLTEYQTVHGSADDIGGKGIVNPTATIRAAARILSHHQSCDKVLEATERALKLLVHGTGDLRDRFERGGTAKKTHMFLEQFHLKDQKLDLKSHL